MIHNAQIVQYDASVPYRRHDIGAGQRREINEGLSTRTLKSSGTHAKALE